MSLSSAFPGRLHSLRVSRLSLSSDGLRRSPRRRPRRHVWQNSSTDKFPRPEKAIDELAAEAPPQGAAILEALGDNRLLINPADHVVAYRTATGAVLNAKTGATIADASGVQEGARQQCAQERYRRRNGLADPRQPRSAETSRRSRGRVQDARRQGAAGASRRNSPRKADPRVAEAFKLAEAAIFATSDSATAKDRSGRHRHPESARRRRRPEAWSTARAEGDRSGTSRPRPNPLSPRSTRVLAMWRLAQNLWYGLSAASRSCCSRRSASPSLSASWASSTWRTARW